MKSPKIIILNLSIIYEIKLNHSGRLPTAIMCKLFRHVCQCCRLIFLHAPQFERKNSICYRFQSHRREAEITRFYNFLFERRCIQILIIIPRGVCRWCSVHCLHSKKQQLVPCHGLLESDEIHLKCVGFLLRFSYEDPFSTQSYHVRELLRLHYCYEDDHRRARHFHTKLMKHLF